MVLRVDSSKQRCLTVTFPNVVAMSVTTSDFLIEKNKLYWNTLLHCNLVPYH